MIIATITAWIVSVSSRQDHSISGTDRGIIVHSCDQSLSISWIHTAKTSGHQWLLPTIRVYKRLYFCDTVFGWQIMVPYWLIVATELVVCVPLLRRRPRVNGFGVVLRATKSILAL